MKTPSHKWIIHKDPDRKDSWWARVPWGTYNRFGSWEDAAEWLQWKYEKRGRR